MCQPLQQPGPLRPAWIQAPGSIAVLERFGGVLRSVWVKLWKMGRGDTGRTVRQKVAHDNIVQLDRRTSDGHFSRTTTIAGSFTATSRCCGKDDEECNGGIRHQNRDSGEDIMVGNMELAFERGRTLARGFRKGRNKGTHFCSSERSPTLQAKSKLLMPSCGGKYLDGDGK